MKKFHYSTGELVQLNDEVRIEKKSLFSKGTSVGKVVYLPDYNQPIKREVNDYGVSIKTGDGKEIWCDDGDGELDKGVVFNRRGV